MTKKEFLEQYILTRISHKKPLDALLEEALKAYNFIDEEAEKEQVRGKAIQTANPM